jgi:hypothetical protein
MPAFAAGFAPIAFDAGLSADVWTPVADLARALPVTLSVISDADYNAAIGAGSVTPLPGAGYTGRLGAVWTPIITVAGADVTARCVGGVRVMAREGAARIAEFTLAPLPGEGVSVAAWVGRPVTVSVAKKYPDGGTGAPRRLFTGIIDSPAPNLTERMVAISATDDLQGVIDALSDAAIDALTGGRWSAVIFDPAASHGWRRALDRLSTRPASLDLDPFRAPRTSAWSGGAESMTFTADDIEDGSVAVAVAPRAQLVNQVDIAFDYRYPRLKIEGYGVSWSYGSNWYVYAGVEGRQVLTRQAVESALSSAGATVQGEISWKKIPDTFAEPGVNYVWVTNPQIQAVTCRGFSCLCTFDYAKYNEEGHRIRVRNDASIAQVGVRATSLQSSLEGAYMEPTTYEAHTFLAKSGTNKALQPTNKLTASSGVTRAQNPELSPETNRAAADAAMMTLIDIAKTTIAGSHRGSSVDFTVPIHPGIDLPARIRVTTAHLSARGKVSALTHSMDTDTGRAVTEVTLSISALSGVGIAHPETPTAAPPEDEPANMILGAGARITWNSGPDEDHAFSIEFPGVEAAERAKTVKEIESTYAAPIAEDLFQLIF